jgi:hypothetical protein
MSSACKKHLAKLVHDLEQLDAVILQFDPGRDIASIKLKASRPPADWPKRGEMGRVLLGILRQPLSTRDIATAIMTQRALNVGQAAVPAHVQSAWPRPSGTTATRARSGPMDGPGMYNFWEIVK